MNDKRFVPVRVAMVQGIYDGRFLGWAVADREKANSIVSAKYWQESEAQQEADRLEKEQSK